MAGLNPGEVALMDPDGQLVAVPSEQARLALQQGFTAPNAVQQKELENRTLYGKGALNSLAAAAFGAARGVSFGLSDQLLTKTGAFDSEALDQLKERHGLASGVGEALGIGGSLLAAPESAVGRLGGAARGVSRLGEAVADGVGGLVGTEGSSLAVRAAQKFARRGAGSAIEGALYKGGDIISEDALGHPADVGEGLMAKLGLAAIFGGVAGGVLGAGGQVAQEAVQGAGKFLSKLAPAGSIKDHLEEIAGNKSLEAAGLMLKDYRKLQKTGVPSLADATGETANEVDAVGMPTNAEARTSLLDEAKRVMREKDIVKAGDSLADVAGKLQKTVEEAQAKTLQFSKAIDDVAEQEGAPRFNPREYADTLRKELVEPLKNRPAKQKIYEAIKAEADKYDQLAESQGENLSFSQAEQLKRDFDYLFDMNNAKGVNAALRQARGILNKQIEEKSKPLAEKLGETAFAEWKANKRALQSLIPVRDATVDRIQRLAANRDLSPTDYATGLTTALGSVIGGGAGGPVGAVVGGITAMAHKYIRERGNSFAADVANRASRLAAIERANNSVTQQISDGVTGFLDSFDSAGSKLAAPASVGAMDTLFLGPREDKQRTAQSRQDVYKQRLGELSAIVSDPQQTLNRLHNTVGGLYEDAPQVSSQLALSAVRAANFLYSKAAKNPGFGGPTLTQSHWHPSDTDIAKFERYAAAVQNPASVMEDMRHGVVTQEGVEALRVVYPRMYQRITQAILPALANKPNIPYAARMQLSTLFGVPADTTARPEFVRAQQAMHAQSELSTGPQHPAPVGKSSIVASAKTHMQQVLERV